MQKISLPIDTKSLYYNIKNDNNSGHTATVATSIKQGNSTNEKLSQVYKIPMQIDFQSKPGLMDSLIKGSKSMVKITNVFTFDKIFVNGEKIFTNKSFCFYVKEEIDPQKYQFGRLKLHYPTTLKYEDNDIDIDNKEILTKISEKLKNYAFLVNSFEYDFDTDSLNFGVTIVGENQIPYSKVFINNKGMGNKYSNIFNEYADSYDMEIISLKKYFNNQVDPDNYRMIMASCQEKAYELCLKYLKNNNYDKIENIGSDYSYSLYDFKYECNGKTKYILLFYTSTNQKYFNISSKKLKFLNEFEEDTEIILITKILNEPQLKKYKIEDLKKFSKSINSLMLREDFKNE